MKAILVPQADVDEAFNMAQNWPLWMLLAANGTKLSCGACHCMVLGRNDDYDGGGG